MFNPIIPVLKRRPKVWRDRISNTPIGAHLVSGYLDAFDPDFVVTVGDCSAAGIDVGNREVIGVSTILDGADKDGTPQYAIGMFEIVRDFIRKEMRFVRRESLDVIHIAPEGHLMFLAAVFGLLPQELDRLFRAHFADALGCKEIRCSIRDYADHLTPGKLFIRRLSSLNLTPVRSQGWGRGDCVFYLDADNALDVLDYWNLRAIGWTVIPVAKQASDVPALCDAIKKFIEESYRPALHTHVAILKSRSVQESEFEQFVDGLGLPRQPDAGWPRWLKYLHYPRIWDEWARPHDGVVCCGLEAAKEQHDLAGEQEGLTFRTVAPDFIDQFGGHGSPRYANEVELRYYGAVEPFAEVIPEGDRNLVRAIGGIDFDAWRFSKRGMVYLARHADWSVHLSAPKAEDIVQQWLRARGWSIELSSTGRLAKQMLKRLGGVVGVGRLANQRTIQLLERMAPDKTVKKDAFWSEINRIANEEEYVKDPVRILSGLMETDMFRLGIEVQCPVCTQHSWYALDNADYAVQCQKCLETFKLPTHSPNDIEWSYRTFGPFSLPYQAHGAYAVLLTLRFLAGLRHEPTTPLLSFVARKSGLEMEADLALFAREMRFGLAETYLLFTECKTFNEFGPKDMLRMRQLGDEFPGAVLVFATLKPSLTGREKRLLSRIANRGRRYWKAERPYNPVLILTGTELFANWKPPTSWEKAGGRHATFASNAGRFWTLLELCDATQQLYLDLPPWQTWLQQRWEKRRLRLRRRPAGPEP
jgi:hypothetical protein